MTPDSIASQMTQASISTFDIDKPERLNVLYNRYNDQGIGFFLLLKSMGFLLPVAQDNYSHHEENWIHIEFHSRNLAAATGPGNNILITLDTDDLDADDQFYPRVKDKVMFSNNVVGIILSIDVSTPAAPVLTIRPNKTTEDIGPIAADEAIIIISNANSEGSNQPGSAFTGTIKYTNFTQIIKEDFSVTGSEMTNQKWFEKMSDGRTISSYYIKGQLDQDFRMTLKMDGALMFETITDNAVLDPFNNRPIQTTQGLIPYTRQNGHQIPHTAGSWSLSKFDTISKIFIKEFASKSVCVLDGHSWNVENSNVLVDHTKDTNVDLVRRKFATTNFGSSDDLMASLDFSYLHKGKFDYIFKGMPLFDHPKLYNAPGFGYSDMALFLPIGMKKAKMGLVEKKMPTFGCRYKKQGAYSRQMETWVRSGAGPGLKVLETDEMIRHMRCDIGGHNMAGNQYVFVDLTA